MAVDPRAANHAAALRDAWAKMEARAEMQRAHDMRVRAEKGVGQNVRPDIPIDNKLSMWNRHWDTMERIAKARNKEIAEARAAGKSEADIKAIVKEWDSLFPSPPPS